LKNNLSYMAIELTPQKRTRAPLLMTIVGITAVFIILAFLGSYIYFYIVNNSIAKKIKELDDSSQELNNTIKSSEDQLLAVQKKINDFSVLIANHKDLKNVFDFIDQKTIPAMWFSDFKFDQSKKEEENIIYLEGKTSSFILIEQQLAVFKKESVVKLAELTEVSINKDGEIEFIFKINFLPEIFILKIEENPPENAEQGNV